MGELVPAHALPAYPAALSTTSGYPPMFRRTQYDQRPGHSPDYYSADQLGKEHQPYIPELGQDAPDWIRRRLSKAELEELDEQQLQTILHSAEHHARTVSRDYGPRDPLNRPELLIYRCDQKCGARLVYDTPTPQQLAISGGEKLQQAQAANSVRCDACGKDGPPSLRDWRAVVDWNFLHAREGRGSLDGFPFFQLDGLVLEEAIAKLESIRYDLTVRRTLERKKKKSGAAVGGRYLAKIEAYLGWASVGLAYAKHLEENGAGRRGYLRRPR